MNAKQIIRCASAVSLALALSPAFGADNNTNAQPLTGKEKATAIGAGTGAVAGAVVGGPIGAVVGGVAGGVIGHEGTDSHGRVNSSNSPGSAGPADSTVASAQTALNSQGYDVGSADGRMGPATRSGVSKFQADHNLPQTGSLDSATLSALGINR